MARFRVEFSRDWIMGRWGFIDHMFHVMGGVPTDQARLENAWLVDYRQGAGALGKMLAKRLELKQADYSQFGVIFDIQELGQPKSGTPGESRDNGCAPRLDAPEN